MPRTRISEQAPAGIPTLATPVDKIGFIIAKARVFDEKVADSDPDERPNPTDDGNADIPEDKPGYGARQELAGAIDALSANEEIEYVDIGRKRLDMLKRRNLCK